MNPEELHDLKQRVSDLELHRQYDMEQNERQDEKLKKLVDSQEELKGIMLDIKVGFRWFIRIGKFMCAIAAFVLTVLGIKHGISK